MKLLTETIFTHHMSDIQEVFVLIPLIVSLLTPSLEIFPDIWSAASHESIGKEIPEQRRCLNSTYTAPYLSKSLCPVSDVCMNRAIADISLPTFLDESLALPNENFQELNNPVVILPILRSGAMA